MEIKTLETEEEQESDFFDGIENSIEVFINMIFAPLAIIGTLFLFGFEIFRYIMEKG